MSDSPYVIETKSLSFRYGDETVLHDVSLSIPKGCIYGYLGRNGAGKTTTLKICLGLLNGHTGQVRVFGEAPEANGSTILPRTGALIEAPSLYDHLSGWDNVRLTALLRRTPTRRIGDVLDIVGLAASADKQVGAYSQGMRQRLGIALALLPEPDLLVLDEPTNGLDPDGIREMRALFLRLNRELGTTLFLSSHILSEVEKTCTRIGIIESGRLVFEDDLDAFRAIGTTSVVMRVSDPARADRILTTAGHVQTPAIERGEIQWAFLDDHDTATRLRVLIQGGVDVFAVESRRMDLESFYFDRIQRGAPS